MMMYTVTEYKMGSKTDAVMNSISCLRPWYLWVPFKYQAD